jgi:thiamine-monophosphate kinase
MVVGSVPRGKAILRSTARPEDIIYVTGALGGSAAMLKALFATGKVPKKKAASSHFYPEPRLAIGNYLREHRLATSMIDISDGLSTDLAHICEESAVGAVLNQNLVPIAGGANLELALRGGEDYELLFTARKSAKVPVEIGGVPIMEVGWITREKKMLITDCKHPPKRLEVRGWEHFR